MAPSEVYEGKMVFPTIGALKWIKVDKGTFLVSLLMSPCSLNLLPFLFVTDFGLSFVLESFLSLRDWSIPVV